LWLWLFYPYKIYGKENLIQDGNVIVICNHLGKVDVPMVGYLFKGKTYYLAKKEWFNKNFSTMGLNERLEHLEEFVFGTSFNEEAESRLDRLKQAFNSRKQPSTTHNGLFSGIPTSIPLDIDGLTQP
jgi:hypothetical protein